MSVLDVPAAKTYCAVPGCAKLRAASGPPPGRASLCRGHQARKQRHGDVQAHIPLLAHKKGPWLRPDGYLSEWRPGHPVSGVNGEVLVHRRVLFDAIGAGIHQCHWCECDVVWGLPTSDPSALVVDHLDEDKQNNALENLVPSCLPCNVRRSPKGRAR